MAKKRKTRKQKILAEQRVNIKRELPPVLLQQETVSISLTQTASSTAQAVKPSSTQTLAATDYHYLSYDLRKVAILTASTIIIELLIRLLVK